MNGSVIEMGEQDWQVYVIQPLQKLQNFAARLVLLAPTTTTQYLSWKKMHWLPISERIKYKVACMCFSAINGSGSVYL